MSVSCRRLAPKRLCLTTIKWRVACEVPCRYCGSALCSFRFFQELHNFNRLGACWSIISNMVRMNWARLNWPCPAYQLTFSCDQPSPRFAAEFYSLATCTLSCGQATLVLENEKMGRVYSRTYPGWGRPVSVLERGAGLAVLGWQWGHLSRHKPHGSLQHLLPALCFNDVQVEVRRLPQSHANFHPHHTWWN